MISVNTGSQKTVGGQTGMVTVISKSGIQNVELMRRGNLQMIAAYGAI